MPSKTSLTCEPHVAGFLGSCVCAWQEFQSFFFGQVKGGRLICQNTYVKLFVFVKTKNKPSIFIAQHPRCWDKPTTWEIASSFYMFSFLLSTLFLSACPPVNLSAHQQLLPLCQPAKTNISIFYKNVPQSLKTKRHVTFLLLDVEDEVVIRFSVPYWSKM